ncbi:hypothetical protein H4K36_02305 [Streptomyces sp. DHE7-1]|nr:hypothetical protein [Streptomyces sp. DHE7-1]
MTAMFAGAARALEPGGRLVAITVNPGYDVHGDDRTRYGPTVHAARPAPAATTCGSRSWPPTPRSRCPWPGGMLPSTTTPPRRRT